MCPVCVSFLRQVKPRLVHNKIWKSPQAELVPPVYALGLPQGQCSVGHAWITSPQTRLVKGHPGNNPGPPHLAHLDVVFLKK